MSTIKVALRHIEHNPDNSYTYRAGANSHADLMACGEYYDEIQAALRTYSVTASVPPFILAAIDTNSRSVTLSEIKVAANTDVLPEHHATPGEYLAAHDASTYQTALIDAAVMVFESSNPELSEFTRTSAVHSLRAACAADLDLAAKLLRGEARWPEFVPAAQTHTFHDKQPSATRVVLLALPKDMLTPTDPGTGTYHTVASTSEAVVLPKNLNLHQIVTLYSQLSTGMWADTHGRAITMACVEHPKEVTLTRSITTTIDSVSKQVQDAVNEAVVADMISGKRPVIEAEDIEDAIWILTELAKTDAAAVHKIARDLLSAHPEPSHPTSSEVFDGLEIKD